MVPRFLGWQNRTSAVCDSDSLHQQSNALSLLCQAEPSASQPGKQATDKDVQLPGVDALSSSISRNDQQTSMLQALWSDGHHLNITDGFKIADWKRELNSEMLENVRRQPREHAKTNLQLPKVSEMEKENGVRISEALILAEPITRDMDRVSASLEGHKRLKAFQAKSRLQQVAKDNLESRRLAAEWLHRQKDITNQIRFDETHISPQAARRLSLILEFKDDENEGDSHDVERRRRRLHKVMERLLAHEHQNAPHEARDNEQSTDVTDEQKTGKELRQRIRNAMMRKVEKRAKDDKRLNKLLQLRKERTGDLPESERLALEEAFVLFMDGSELLPVLKLGDCLEELGLQGENHHERSLVDETCKHLVLDLHQEQECVDHSEEPPPEIAYRRSTLIKRRTLTTIKEASHEQLHPICFADFCAVIVPALRAVLSDAREDRHFDLFMKAKDDVTTAVIRPKVFKELAKRFSIDQDLVDATLMLSSAGKRQSVRKSLSVQMQELDFETVHSLLMKLKEKTTRQRRVLEREIKGETNMPDSMFFQYRNDLINLKGICEAYAADHSGFMTSIAVKQSLKHLGLHPYQPSTEKFIDNIIRECDQDMNDKIDFYEFLTVMDRVRAMQKKSRRWKILRACDTLESYDIHNGLVQIEDLERLLYASGLRPKNWSEQQHIREMLDEIDDDGTGTISIQETEDLYQHIVEDTYKRIQDENRRIADSLGYTAESLAELQWAFDQYDLDSSGTLSLAEIERAVKILMPHPPSRDDLIKYIAQIESGDIHIAAASQLKFPEFIRLMQLVSNGQTMLSMTLPYTLKDVPDTTLKDILRLFSLSDRYIEGIPSTDLPSLAGGYLGLAQNVNLLQLQTPVLNDRHLLTLAKKRALQEKEKTSQGRTRNRNKKEGLVGKKEPRQRLSLLPSKVGNSATTTSSNTIARKKKS